jgi:PAS domain-containing protein
MTAMFKPPIAQEKAVNWSDLLRIGKAEDPFWTKVRASQLRFLARYMPFNLAVSITNGAVVLAALADKIEPQVLAVWFGLNLVMGVLWVSRDLSERRAGRVAEPTPDFLIWVVCEMAVVGIAWGLLFAAVLPVLDPGDAMLVVAMTMAAVGCTAFTTAIFPLGALALSGPVVLGTVVGVVLTDWQESWMVSLVIASFILVAIRGNILTTFAFLARMKTQDRLIEQEEVVRLLLNEFEANGSDWLFEFDTDGKLTFASARFAEALRRPVQEVVCLLYTSPSPRDRG